jgi:N-acetylglucosamine kinase-like BadF-type ATPase
MAMDCYLGVDGGGTKTRFALVDGEARLLAEAQCGTTYHPQVGLDGVRATLREGIDAVLASAGIGPADLRHAFFGLPAFGEDSRVDPLLDAIPRELLGHGRYACGNDMVCGWAGSFACGDGINIVAGTGSIGYGQRRGHAARAGGWGEVFSDEGSAYWIAVQGLNAFSRMADGRLPMGPLHAMLREHLGIGPDLDLCAHVYGESAMSRGEIAQLSRLVAAAAEDGDAAACAIFRQAGEELAAIADALRGTLGFEADEPVRVSWSGGAFSAGELLRAPFIVALQARSSAFEPHAPLHPPHLGAALYALALAQEEAPRAPNAPQAQPTQGH